MQENSGMTMQRIYWIGLCWIVVFLASCDAKRVFEKNIALQDAEWNYLEKPVFEVEIKDTQALYNLHVNFRYEAEYPYNNIFFLLNTYAPDSAVNSERVECVLFDNYGLPKGKGLGDMFFVQYKIRSKMRFPKPGQYHFILEQNMRTDHLKGVHDVGLRLEKAE